MMDLLVAAYLGLLQGLTEFLPVSSSGHLVLSQVVLRKLGLGLEGNDLFFDALLHLGTLCVVLRYYRKELLHLFLEWIGKTGSELPSTTIPPGGGRIWTGFLLVSTGVTTVLALPMQDPIETAFSRPLPVGVGLLFTGTILLGSWKVASKEDSDSGTPLTWGGAFLIGLAQALAVSPGVSRSGTTIAMALFLGMKREQAVTYSFLLSIPAILGGVLLTALKIHRFAVLPAMIGMGTAAFFGWLALRWLVRLVVRGRLLGFSLYCYGLGCLTVALSLLWR